MNRILYRVGVALLVLMVVLLVRRGGGAGDF